MQIATDNRTFNIDTSYLPRGSTSMTLAGMQWPGMSRDGTTTLPLSCCLVIIAGRALNGLPLLVRIEVHVSDILDTFAHGASDKVITRLTADRLVKRFRKTIIDAIKVKEGKHSL